MDSDNASLQAEEIEALCAIYTDSLLLADPEARVLEFELKDDRDKSKVIRLNIKMSEHYPTEGPPSYEMSAPFLSSQSKFQLDVQLNNVYADNPSEPMIHLWVEAVKDFLEKWIDDANGTNQEHLKNSTETKEVNNLSSDLSQKTLAECPEILTGSVIEDRKSVFQGHFAKVNSEEEARLVLAKLMENKKIANATHNMYAFRILNKSGTVLSHCEDDGETKAGSRMLELLNILDVTNVLVVVSRWYGGVKLGPDRFKHINNAARSVLDEAGAIRDRQKKSSKK